MTFVRARTFLSEDTFYWCEAVVVWWQQQVELYGGDRFPGLTPFRKDCEHCWAGGLCAFVSPELLAGCLLPSRVTCCSKLHQFELSKGTVRWQSQPGKVGKDVQHPKKFWDLRNEESGPHLPTVPTLSLIPPNSSNGDDKSHMAYTEGLTLPPPMTFSAA